MDNWKHDMSTVMTLDMVFARGHGNGSSTCERTKSDCADGPAVYADAGAIRPTPTATSSRLGGLMMTAACAACGSRSTTTSGRTRPSR